MRRFSLQALWGKRHKLTPVGQSTDDRGPCKVIVRKLKLHVLGFAGQSLGCFSYVRSSQDSLNHAAPVAHRALVIQIHQAMSGQGLSGDRFIQARSTEQSPCPRGSRFFQQKVPVQKRMIVFQNDESLSHRIHIAAREFQTPPVSSNESLMVVQLVLRLMRFSRPFSTLPGPTS